ncbi:hypothetical protein NSS91_01230 [Caldifermentibacillus hisashii]|uniref:hypothetical protein n=1 Tax=Caldifermentibacillus hisashii TaxID=996558 RepID=UPI0031FD997D
MTTKRLLVAILGRGMLNFGDEPQSRHHFEVKNVLFWRRASFSSPFLVGKLHFLATRPVLVTIFR